MKKTIFILVFLVVIINVNAQESCLVPSNENAAIVAQRILYTYSQIDSLGITPQQAVLDSLGKWQPSEDSLAWESHRSDIRRAIDRSDDTILAQQIIDDAFTELYTAELLDKDEDSVLDVIPNPFKIIADKITESIEERYPGLSEPLYAALAILLLKDKEGELDTRGFEINAIIPELVGAINPDANFWERDDNIFALSIMNYLYFYGTDMFLTYGELVVLSEIRNGNELSEREREIKDRIAKTINPYGYEKIKLPDKIERFVSNIPRFDRENVDQLGVLTKIRVDLFRKYLGLNQYYGLVIESRYPPPPEFMRFTDENYKGGVYRYSSEGVIHFMKDWTSGVFFRPSVPLTFDNFVETYFDNPTGRVVTNKNNFLARHPLFNNLGTFEFGIGYDDERKERYIYYFDYWDLDPPDLVARGISIDRINFPIVLYDRLYESDFNEYLANEEEFSTYWDETLRGTKSYLEI